ncbi:MAG: OmpH family outer membrane protein [Planctomycetota bacterium]|nr:OmpH family outer membrane protein [Planctomycetota bacterium]
MNGKHVALLSLLIAAATVVSITPSRAPAQAQGQAPAAGGQFKIATASAAKIFMGMKEKTDVRAKIEQQVKQLREEEQSRRQKVQDVQQQMELLKPDSPQYEEANKTFMAAAIEFKNWGEVSQAQAARHEKLLTKMLFDKITAAIAAIAKERGIDFVVAEQPPFAVERMTPQDLQQAMVQRQVLYANASLDLTQDVIGRLDEQYNAGKK